MKIIGPKDDTMFVDFYNEEVRLNFTLDDHDCVLNLSTNEAMELVESILSCVVSNQDKVPFGVGKCPC